MTTTMRPRAAGTRGHQQLHQAGRSRTRWFVITPVVVIAALLAAMVGPDLLARLQDDSGHQYIGADGWPVDGQAAYSIGTAQSQVGPGDRPAPIASLAKVMTALVVLRSSPLDTAPLDDDDDGFRITVSAADVADTQIRRDRDESVIDVAEGEVLTERQALTALLLPSANNIAVMLARHRSGSVEAFVARMNVTARAMGMADTRYTDPSGFEADTVSTAADQLVLAQAAMSEPTFASIVAMPRAVLPVAGTVQNTDFLLGTGGFVGIKTGSHDAAGGCFMFRAYRTIGGRSVVVTGVVLGQPGHRLVAAGQYAAIQLVDRLTSTGPASDGE